MVKTKNGKFAAPKKRKLWPFLIFMGIYAAVFLIITAYGLQEFWGFIEAYENSRPKHVLNGYMDTLTEDHICDMSHELIDSVDHSLQSEEECREVIKQALSGGISYAKKSSESNDSRQVYVLRSGGKVIGQFVMTLQSEDEYGFTYWEVTEESFDMSFLLGEKVTGFAPDHYTVSINGHELNEDYIVGDPIRYDALKSYYDDYSLPTMVTYEAGPFLGDFEMVVTTPEGEVVVMEDVPDLNKLAENCAEEEVENLDAFVDKFLQLYVKFMGSSNRNAEYNYALLIKYVVKDSDLASRMFYAIDGQNAAQSKGDTITSIDKHYFFELEEGKYMVDVTYLVNTIGFEGAVETTNNIRLVIVKTENGYLVEAVQNYTA